VTGVRRGHQREEGEADCDISGADESTAIAVGDIAYMLRFLAPFAPPYRGALLAVGGTLIIDTGFNVSFPLVERYAIDDGLIGHDWSVVAAVIAFLCFAAVATGLLGLLLDYLSARVASCVVADIRNGLFDRLQLAPVGFFHETETGAILSRFSGDTVTVEHALVATIPWLVLPLLEVMYSAAIMFAFNLRLGLVGALVFPLTVFAPKVFARRSFALG